MPAPFLPRALDELLLEEWPAELTARGRGDLPPHFSASQLKQFARCPEQFRRVRVKGERERPSAAMLWGGADHTTFEHNFRGKLTSGEDLPVSDVQTIFAEELDRRIGKDGGIHEVKWANEEEGKRPTGGDAAKAAASVKDRGVQLVTHYRQQVAPAVLPTAVEQPFLVDVSGLPVPIAGTLDLRARFDVGRLPTAQQLGLEAEVDERPRIIERKTAGKTDLNGEWLLQGRVYQLVYPEPLEFHLSIKPRENKRSYGAAKVVAGDPRFLFEPAPAPAIATTLKRVMAGIAYCMTTYGPDQPWPDALAHPWACRYCGFKQTCPYWSTAYWNGDPK